MNAYVLDGLVAALDGAGNSDGNVFVKPASVMWPDHARQWEGAIAGLRDQRRVLTLGPYHPGDGCGPALWLRCVVGGLVEVDGPEGLPILYLPGVSREDLRAVSAQDQVLAPLASLQHRSQWFTQSSGNDWTIRALLSNKDRGLGLNVAGDDATALALVAGLDHLVREPVSRLDGRHIDATFVNGLLNPDPVRLLLRWIDNPSSVQHELAGSAWDAFVAQCKTDFGLDPTAAGVIEAARQLGTGEGAWRQVWRRFCESPAEYDGIPRQLRVARPQEFFTQSLSSWPQDTEAGEDQLRARLLDLPVLTAGGARSEIAALEDEHRWRRATVWAHLGHAPLALALEQLTILASKTGVALPGSDVSGVVESYAGGGWSTDLTALHALREVETPQDLAAVSAALDAIYRPWLDKAARALQDAVGSEANSGKYQAGRAPSPAAGEVVVFVDGLRLDVAHLLIDRLGGAGAAVVVAVALSALPTVTQTAKPALVPIDQGLLAPGDALNACRASTGATAGVQVLRSLLVDAGLQVLGPQETGDPSGPAWTETGEIDHKGHNFGARLAHEINDEVSRIARRIRGLLDAGWSKVTVVTDHGWVLMPSGLPKNDALPVSATVTKKGRCARVKDGAVIDVPTVPWHWDKDVRIAVAPGISCFEANQTYEHGGVSPQECVVPRLTITNAAVAAPSSAEITSIKWRGLTLVVEFSDLPDRARVDLRRQAGDAGSSIADLARVTGGTGKVILLVEDEDLEGKPAQLVVVAADGTVLLQHETVVARNR